MYMELEEEQYKYSERTVIGWIDSICKGKESVKLKRGDTDLTLLDLRL